MQHCYYGDLQGSFEGGLGFFQAGMVALAIVHRPFHRTADAHRARRTVRKRSRASVACPSTNRLVHLYGGGAIRLRHFQSRRVAGGFWGFDLARLHFKSSLSNGALVGLYWKVIGWFLLISASFGAYLYLAAAILAKISDMTIAKLFVAGHSKESIPMLVLAGIGYLVLVLVANVVVRVYLLRDIWERVAISTTVYHLEAVEGVSAAGELASAVGEGLADGLDVFGF